MNKKILLVLIICFSVLGIIMTLTFHPRTRFGQLNISKEEWDAITVSRKEGSISFTSLEFNDYNLVIDDNNSKLYYSVIHSSPSKYTPMISFSSNDPTAKMAILDDEITEDKIQNNHAFKVLLYNENEYRTYQLYCTSFPMINIVYSKTKEMNGFNYPMSMYLFNNSDNGINRIARSEGILNCVEMEDGSYNYKFSLTFTTPGNNERENVISLLNMRPSNEYFLNAINIGENDSTFEKPNNIVESKKLLSDENSMRMIDINNQRVELFINNEYIGLYSLGYNPDIRVKPRNK